MIVDIVPIRREIEERFGSVVKVVPITKGFSDDKKYRLVTSDQEMLLRVSAAGSRTRKQEFALMQKLYLSGVRCNRPLDLFEIEEQAVICALFSYLPGQDAEQLIHTLSPENQFEVGFEAGKDLRAINRVSRPTSDWKARKWHKHQRYLEQYRQGQIRFAHDEKVLRFIDENYDRAEAEVDHLQHDDFHLGNILVNDRHYAGVLDFNRYDWGDPLHEFVKLEWFTWPVSRHFAAGQIAGYFGEKPLSDPERLQTAVYIAMSIVSTVVWTRIYHPKTWPVTEAGMISILERYDYFDNVHPQWSNA